MLGKLINLGKKNNYYLELEDKAEAVASKVKQETKEIAENVKQAVVESETVQEVKSEAQEVTQEVAQKVTKASSQEKKADSKTKSNKKVATQQTASAPAPQVIDTSYSEEPFWVKLMYKTNEQKTAESNAEQTFATDYLISQPKPRRRPGGSVDKFKAMARQTKVRF